MSHESDINNLESHFMSPSYFPPEIVKVARDWYVTTEEQRLAFIRGEGPSALPELVESLAQYGITDQRDVMELIMIASGRFDSQTKEK